MVQCSPSVTIGGTASPLNTQAAGSGPSLRSPIAGRDLYLVARGLRVCLVPDRSGPISRRSSNLPTRLSQALNQLEDARDVLQAQLDALGAAGPLRVMHEEA